MLTHVVRALRLAAIALVPGVVLAQPGLRQVTTTPTIPISSHDGTIRRLDGSTISIAAADSLVRRLVAEHAITGLQVAVINDAKVAWSTAVGIRARGDGTGSAPVGPDLPMQRSTTTWAASITKAVFATFVMQLVDAGRFDLDRPVVQQLPQPLDTYAPYREKASLIVQDARWPSITPRMLLSHTAGLANFATIEPDGRMRLHDAPGTHYRYSGEGINLLQFVIEQRFQQPLELMLDSAIPTPLGMTRTALTFRAAFADDIADRFGAEGQFLAKTRRAPARAAGSMTSTADDLARFAIALLNDRLLPAATRAAMLTPQVGIRGQTQFGPGSDSTTGAEARRLGLAYGLGWGLLTRTRHGPMFFKEGHGDGAQTYLLCAPRSRDCLIILSNSDNAEFAFRALVNGLLGTDEIPRTWEGWTPEQIRASRRGQ